MDFKMPISFSSFLGDFFDEFEKDTLLPEFNPIKSLACDSCGMTFEDFMNTGKFGCTNCYDTFESKIDPILKNIQGSNRHVGRLGKINAETNLKEAEGNEKNANKERKITEKDKLEEELHLAIKEERYEDAAKIRDKINELKEN